jgi:uncharacterized protein (DUF58 family)
MGDAFSFFLVVLIFLAIFTRETFVFVLLYLFIGVSLIGRWWIDRVIKRLGYSRTFEHKVFPGETIPVRLQIKNTSLLPAVWLRVQDYYPIEVADTKSFAQVISLRPRENVLLNYSLKAHKRGLYTVGPLHITSGDLLGMAAEKQSEGAVDLLTVYPKVVALSEVSLPSHSPMGTMRYNQPIFEDPTRSIGKRDYRPGDSLRRIDWKSSAASGRLQTKLFEPSISLETILFLDLNLEDYNPRTRFDATELAIVVCASLANWVISKRQATGLISNGIDPLSSDSSTIPLNMRKNRGHLMRILDILARIKAGDTESFPLLIRRHRVNFPWGTTLIAVTGSAELALIEELVQIRRAGLIPVLVLCGEHPNHRQAAMMAKQFGIPVYVIRTEKDLDIWRK